MTPGAGFSRGPPLPGPRSDFAAAVHQGRVILAGGGVLPKEPLSSTWVLDPGATTWREAAPFPHSRVAVGGVMCGEVFVVAGGLRPTFSTSPRVHAYHPREDRWEELPPLPRSRAWPRLAWVCGELHAVGGWHVEGHERESAVADHHVLPLSTSGAAGTWRESTPLPTALYDGALVVRREELCWVGGAFKMGLPSSSAADLYEMDAARGGYAFDLNAETWRPLPPLPEPRRSAQSLVVRDGIVLVGGLDTQLRPYASGWLLDEDDVWREVPSLPEERHHGVLVGGPEIGWLLGGNFARAAPPTWRIDLSVWPPR